eukprot:271894_1
MSHSILYRTVLLSLSLDVLYGDIYLHYFRGSNNRLNEASANRNNANRLFDSQNNNRGGYNCCDLDVEEGFNEEEYMATASEMYDWRFLYSNTETELEKQYEEMYFVDSEVSVTWTNQHGTGNKKLLSQIILQYGCDTFPRPDEAGADSVKGGPKSVLSSWSTLGDGSGCNGACKSVRSDMRKFGLRMELMNGGNTNTPEDPDSVDGENDGIAATYSANNAANEGRHESEEWYHLCETRRQNYGLFHADQDLQGTSQKYTRQNAAGTRRGLECPEERDYYPYWHPTPWHDISIFTPDTEYCEAEQAPNSQNVMEKCGCTNPNADSLTGEVGDWFPEDAYVEHNLNATKCEELGGKWDCFKWKNGLEPECVESYWSKVNYLGNVDGTTRGGKQAHYDWKLPTWTELRDNQYCYPYKYNVANSPDSDQDSSTTINCVRMVFRIRYNMSTMDYDPYKTNSTHDYNPEGGILSPIEENPEVDVGFYVQGLQLAINTAQTGRTFQDRSHTFLVCNRPASADFFTKPILNVNVRGKRGNIVQTFPATEYDFEPQHVELQPTSQTCLHFQWCGSNTHNNGAPGGDGQTGDDGEGRGGSDRSNLVQMYNMDESYPVAYDKISDEENFFNYVDCYHPLNPGVAVSAADAQLILGTSGFYKSVEYMKKQCADIKTDAENENRGECIVDEVLNNVSGSFRAGLICCLKDDLASSGDYEKVFAFLSTRNNNFSNRSHKWKLVLSAKPDPKSSW